jgi:hypothetical protein
LYVDNTTGEPLHSTVGKCDRADNCGHHYTPKQYFTDNNISFDTERTVSVPQRKFIPKPQPLPSYIDAGIFKKSLQRYEDNRLIQYLCGIVGDEAAKEAVQRYFIGTSNHWDGSTVFWQIDGCGRVHTGKIMQYDSRTGKRVKEPVNKISWVHTVLKLPDFYLSQCLFGEHLLHDTTKMVSIVESEKTAVIASVYLPQFIWLACGGSEGLNPDKCKCLKGRKVILYPDAGMFDKWNVKAGQLQAVCGSMSVSNLIESAATEAQRKAGFDLADYLRRVSPSDYAAGKPQPEDKPTPQQQTQANAPNNAENAPNNTENDNQGLQAFVSDTGTLYIPTPPDRRITYTVYPSVEAYNERSVLPSIIPMQSVDIFGMKQVFINLNALTI